MIAWFALLVARRHGDGRRDGVSDDEGHAVSYKVLARGTPVWTADGTELGTVRDVLENAASTSSTASSSRRRGGGGSSTPRRSRASPSGG